MRDTAEARLYLQTPAREAETDSRRSVFLVQYDGVDLFCLGVI